jgi:hypothetical protein
MKRIPNPPAHFEQLRLKTEFIEPSQLLRLARMDPSTHLEFHEEAHFRFDAPDRSFGVLYAAFDLKTCFVEAELREAPAITPAGSRPVLDYRRLAARRVLSFKSGRKARPLKLIKLYEEGLVAAHTDNRISAIDDYPRTQQWAKAFYEHPLRADGVLYVSRFMAPRLSAVLFNRVADAVAIATITPLLAHPDLPSLISDLDLAIERP